MTICMGATVFQSDRKERREGGMVKDITCKELMNSFAHISIWRGAPWNLLYTCDNVCS